MTEKKKALVTPYGVFKLNQTAPVFKDKRTKRTRDRSTVRRKALEEGKS